LAITHDGPLLDRADPENATLGRIDKIVQILDFESQR
jgi:hypothetical protein